MKTVENATMSAGEEQDSLEDIVHIGRTFARDLHRAGIRSFSDLAQYTPQELSKALSQKAGRAVSPKKIEAERWIDQAREKAQQVNSEPMPFEEEAEKPEDALNHPARHQDEFKFTVTFKRVRDRRGKQVWATTGYDEFRGGDDKPFETYEDFETIGTTEWADWILDRMRQYTGAEPIPTEIRATAQLSQDVQLSRRDEGMDEITLKRGKRDVTFKKVPDRFAVRLTQGRSPSEMALEASLGPPTTKVRHLDHIGPERMDIFSVEELAEMEATVDQLRESPGAGVVSHVYRLGDTADSEVVPTGNLTLQFKASASKERREEILAEFGLEVVEDLDYLPNAYTVRLTDASEENPLKIAAKLQQREEIEVAEPDLAFRVSLEHAPLDPLYHQQWHLKNRGDLLGLVAGADVKAEEAWDYTQGSRDITICVIDDGFDLGHPEFNHPGKIVAARDFGQADFDPNPVFEDDNHGTACAGVALAEEDGTGVVGLAPKCAFMPIRMSPWLTDDTVVSYFQYAMGHDADVISCSWSAAAPYFPLSIKMDGIIHHAATRGRRNNEGCVILFAAGNDSSPLDGQKGGQVYHQGFALHPDVIAVAASNSYDRHASYSNYGPEITICAPSSGSPGRRVVTTDRRGIAGYSSDDYTDDFGGTSSSTPLAAGLAALILSVHPQLTSARVKEIMMDTADKIDQADGQYVNEHSPFYGHGRINAHAAVQYATTLRDQPPLPEDTERIDIEFLDVDLSVVGPTSSIPQERLAAQILFRVTGDDAETLTAAHIPYQIQVQLINRDDEASHLVASELGHLQLSTFEYENRLLFPILALGRYQLKTDVTLQLPSGERKASHVGRRFKVVAG